MLLDLLVIGGIHGFLTLFGKYCSCKCNSWEHLVNFFKGAGLTIKIMTMAMVWITYTNMTPNNGSSEGVGLHKITLHTFCWSKSWDCQKKIATPSWPFLTSHCTKLSDAAKCLQSDRAVNKTFDLWILYDTQEKTSSVVNLTGYIEDNSNLRGAGFQIWEKVIHYYSCLAVKRQQHGNRRTTP